MAVNRTHIANIVRVWKLIRGMTGDQLRALQNADSSLAVVGELSARSALIARLGAVSSGPSEYESYAQAVAAGQSLILDANALWTATEADLNTALDMLVRQRPSTRVALAARFAAFRPIVAEQLTREMAQRNAKLAAMSAIPGIIPLTDWLMPATAAGDMLMLTRNQIDLMLEISACYGLAPDPRARLTELVPIVGSAFGWRAIARELIGLVPGGVGVLVKAVVSYAGTYAVGRAASAYYGYGKSIDMSKAFRAALQDGISKGKGLIGRMPGMS